jgi:hypothetical protein
VASPAKKAVEDDASTGKENAEECRSRSHRIGDTMNDKPTQEQLDQLKRLSKEARVPDESEIVTTREEAELRIRDLKEKARME